MRASGRAAPRGVRRCLVLVGAGPGPGRRRAQGHVPERRGHAHTPDVEGPLTYQVMANDTRGLPRRRGRRPSTPGWLSDGAVVALLVARRRPELVDRLVLIGQYYPEVVNALLVWFLAGAARPSTGPASDPVANPSADASPPLRLAGVAGLLLTGSHIGCWR